MTAPKSAAKRRRHFSTQEKWQKSFFVALGETSNVSLAAERAGITVAHVYRLRRHDSEFANRWLIALCEGYDNLEMELLWRLRNGINVVAKGGKAKKPDEVVKYDNAMALRLLNAHRASATRARALRDADDEEAVLASINAKIDAIRRNSAAAAALGLDGPDYDDADE